MICHIEEKEDADRSKLIQMRGFQTQEQKCYKMAENLVKNVYFQKYQSDCEVDSNLGVPSWVKKNANLKTNNNTKSHAGTLKR